MKRDMRLKKEKIESAAKDIHAEVLQLIETRREELNLTHQEMADLLGISSPFYYRIEKGKRTLTLEQYIKIMYFLKKNPGLELFTLCQKRLPVSKMDDKSNG